MRGAVFPQVGGHHIEHGPAVRPAIDEITEEDDAAPLLRRTDMGKQPIEKIGTPMNVADRIEAAPCGWDLT
ncbi:hypothetical protein GCM10007923_35220 [Shinella yambaruensis]|uniref:Uncharacterized protein n=1 Tax=Shinella yambaruensis TaxID=415996 RepID=A0ABQ5ZN52_9HYPH|nr:hypothetical protein GCM10007923_35220 [Shinella yambaruensis]